MEKEDEDRFQKALSDYNDDEANYDPRADLNHDGRIDSDDESAFYSSFDRFGGLTGNWKLSQGDGLTPGGTGADAGLDNRFGWRGYWYDSHLQKYHVRNRVYDPREGRWMQNDPLGFAAGDQDLHRYCNGEYSMGYDPLGLAGACAANPVSEATPTATQSVLGFGLDLLMGGGGAGTATTMATSQRNCDTFRQMKAEGKLTNQQFLTVWNNGGCGGGATATIVAQTGAAFMQGYGHGLADGGILAINTFSFDYLLSEDAARIREENAGDSWYAAAQISLNISRGAAMMAAGMWAQGGIAAAAANGNVAAWWLNAGISSYYVATGSYQVGTGVNMMANGQFVAGGLNIIGGGLTAAGGFGTATAAGALPRSQGIVYLRTNPHTGAEYVGRSWSSISYKIRQRVHNALNGVTYNYLQIGRAPNGNPLRAMEELHIRLRGGPSARGGQLENIRYEMNELDFRNFYPHGPSRPTP